MSGNSDGYCIFYLFARDSEWSIEPLFKGVAGLEDGGQQEVEKGPQLWQLVLQGRACQQQPVVGGVVCVEDLGEFTVVVLHTFAAYIRNKTVLLLVDAEAVEGALVKGYSSRSDLCELVGVFWDIVVELRALIYIDNCSDPPSRNKFSIGEKLGWKTVPAHWPKQVWCSS